MKTILIATVAATFGLASFAHADRYERQRAEASARYGQGSRAYAGTYGRYGQSTVGLRTDYDRDYARRYDAGPRYYAGRPSYSGFSVGFGAGQYYGRDSVSIGFHYSTGPRYYYGGPRYYRSDYYCPPVYYAPAPVYYEPAPVYYAPAPVVVYPAPTYYSAPSYYDRGGTSFYFESRSYYGR